MEYVVVTGIIVLGVLCALAVKFALIDGLPSKKNDDSVPK